jgi:hypothetical protein
VGTIEGAAWMMTVLVLVEVRPLKDDVVVAGDYTRSGGGGRLGATERTRFSRFARLRGFVVDAIMDSADLAFDRSEAVAELVDCFVEFRFRDHVILDEIDGLKNVPCVFVHMRGSIPWRFSGVREGHYAARGNP